MYRRFRLWTLAAVLAPAAAQAQVANPFAQCGSLPGRLTSPFAWLVVNGTCLDLSTSIVPAIPGKTWNLTATVPVLDVLDAVRVTAQYNADPFITFGATTMNVVPGPTTYAFLFGTPIVPGLYTTATSTGGVTVTNGAGGTAVVAAPGVYPTYISGYGTVGLAATNLGVDLGTAACQAGPGAPAGVTQTCNQGNASNTFAPAFYDNLEALLTYTQTDALSVASWSGGVTLSAANTTVPEPSSLALVLGGGLLLVGAGSLRRARRER